MSRTTLKFMCDSLGFSFCRRKSTPATAVILFSRPLSTCQQPGSCYTSFRHRARHCFLATFWPNLRAHIILSKETSTETGTCSDDCNECHLKIIRERYYTCFQCYLHRQHLRSSFDMLSFDRLCNLAHIKMLTQRTLSSSNSTFSRKRWIYLTSN